jgi:glycosyltransferase involved in cell wall biosynthesis
MNDKTLIKQRFSVIRCCVIIPTYNNDHALEQVIEGVLSYLDDVIVVNDGCTDSTYQILARYPQLRVIMVPENRGKGWALRLGFELAYRSGFDYAITIDSDGQHYPDDLPLFLEMIEQNPGALILGARNMSQEEVPETSSFGHKFSIFWFKVETGLNVPDVQTGYRLYPLAPFSKVKRVVSRKYEYEVEILVRFAWMGIRILSVPVKVYYAPREIRVTHFRKVRDFTRVSIANTILVFVALLWVRPFAFIKSLRKRSIKELFTEYVVNSKDSNLNLTLSMSLGLFIGVMPIWGWQMMAAFALAQLFRLNKFIAVAASNISIPPILPLIIFASYMAGGWILGLNTDGIRYDSGMGLHWIKENLIQYLIGSLILGVAMVAVMGPVTYVLLTLFRKKNG